MTKNAFHKIHNLGLAHIEDILGDTAIYPDLEFTTLNRSLGTGEQLGIRG